MAFDPTWPKPWWRDPWQWALVVFGIGIAFVPVVVLWPQSWHFEHPLADGIALLGAIGSLAAAFVALWLGLSANARSRGDEMVRARIVAARVDVAIEWTLTRLWLVSQSCMLSGFNPVPRSDDRLDVFFDLLDWPVERGIDLDTLVYLAPLPGHCAARVSSGFAMLEHLRSAVRSLKSEDPQLADSLRSVAFGQVETWEQIFVRAERHLRAAQRVCREAASIGAPDPTGDELYDSDEPGV